MVSLGTGADIFTSGAGNDTVTGGGGLDEFHFNVTTNAGNTDVITDFAVDTDTIVLEGGTGTLTYLGDDSGWTSGTGRKRGSSLRPRPWRSTPTATIRRISASS